MGLRSVEIRERALGILGVTSIHDTDGIRRSFRRQIRLIHPDGPDRLTENVPGFTDADMGRLLIQAYRHLIGRPCPTTMLENDVLLGRLLDGRITLIAQTVTAEEWDADRFYEQSQHSIWPESPSGTQDPSWKFKGFC